MALVTGGHRAFGEVTKNHPTFSDVTKNPPASGDVTKSPPASRGVKNDLVSTVSNTNVSLIPTNPLKLLVLDLNGVLCHKIYKPDDTLDPKIHKPIDLNKHNLYLRPGVKAFLNEVFSLNDLKVAIFSSTTYPNVDLILKQLITTKQRKKLKFLWCRDRCSLDPEYDTRDDIKKYDTIKRIETIIESPYVNAKREYNKDNILFIDDSALKMRYNPKTSYYIVAPYDPQTKSKDNIFESTLLEHIKSHLPKTEKSNDD